LFAHRTDANQPEIVDAFRQLGWVVHANTLGSNYAHKAGALTAARENLGRKGISLMLRKMKLESAEDVVEWLAK
jgi:hypothetical protein